MVKVTLKGSVDQVLQHLKRPARFEDLLCDEPPKKTLGAFPLRQPIHLHHNAWAYESKKGLKIVMDHPGIVLLPWKLLRRHATRAANAKSGSIPAGRASKEQAAPHRDSGSISDTLAGAAPLTEGGETCEHCKGSGTVKVSSYGLGPDDYETDVECPRCKGTGVESLSADSKPDDPPTPDEYCHECGKLKCEPSCPSYRPADSKLAEDDERLLPGLREALLWKPNTPQLENAMTYAWEQSLKSFIRAIEAALRSKAKGE